MLSCIYMNNMFNNPIAQFSGDPQIQTILMILWLVLIVWSLYWKGRALWKAARLYDRNWFIALLIINIFGLLEIFYIYKIAKPKEAKLRAEQDKATSPTPVESPKV